MVAVLAGSRGRLSAQRPRLQCTPRPTFHWSRAATGSGHLWVKTNVEVGSVNGLYQGYLRTRFVNNSLQTEPGPSLQEHQPESPEPPSSVQSSGNRGKLVPQGSVSTQNGETVRDPGHQGGSKDGGSAPDTPRPTPRPRSRSSCVAPHPCQREHVPLPPVSPPTSAAQLPLTVPMVNFWLRLRLAAALPALGAGCVLARRPGRRSQVRNGACGFSRRHGDMDRGWRRGSNP